MTQCIAGATNYATAFFLIHDEVTMGADEVRQREKYKALIARCRGLPPIPTAVAHPCDESSLSGAIDAAEAGIIQPFLVGPAPKIRAVAEKLKLNLDGYGIVDPPTAMPPPGRRLGWCDSEKLSC